MIKFSIIIVSYNGEKYIKECINNLKKQTFKNYEIIFVDDGSNDSTEEIIKEYNDIKYYRIEHGGVSKARNYGISKAKGLYFIFVDVDDFINENLLYILNENTKEEKDLVKYNYKTIETYKDIGIINNNYSSKNCNGTDLFEYLCFKKEAFDLICIYLYNTKFWKENRFSFKEGTYHEDFGIIPYVILKAKNATCLNYIGYFYVQTQDSITRSNDRGKNVKKAYDYLSHYDFLYDKVNMNKEFDINTKALFNSYISNALITKLGSLDSNERKKYLSELKKRNVFNNLKSDTLVRKIKKILLKLSPNLYLKVIK